MRKTVIKELEESAVINKPAVRLLSDLVIGAIKNTLRIYRKDKRVLLAGNGDSTVYAQHITSEFVGRFLNERKTLPVITFTIDVSLLPAVSNEYYYERVFKHRIETFGEEVSRSPCETSSRR